MTKDELKDFLRKKPSYLKRGKHNLAHLFGMNPEDCLACVRYVKKERKRLSKPVTNKKKGTSVLRALPEPFISGDPDNVLVIGDLHEPFSLDGYLEFCREIQEQENCGIVVFIGDVIDNHYSSYHETDPDGFSAGEELDRAISKIAEWYKVFPVATVIIGNHDRMAYRKMHSAGVSQRWVRNYNEVLETPNWSFLEELEVKDICFNHGEGGTARTKMRKELQSQVQGHLHSDFYIEYAVGPKARIFGMQVGCGIDRHAYAMAYGKRFKKPVIGCATVNNGIPKLHPMDLK